MQRYTARPPALIPGIAQFRCGHAGPCAARREGAPGYLLRRPVCLSPSARRVSAASAAAELSPEVEEPKAQQHTDADLAELTRTRKASKTFNIVFVASEAAPFSKTGGLGDVCGSLPPALAARGHRVMCVVPRYADYEGAEATGLRVDIFGNEVGYHLLQSKGVDWVFVDHPSYPRPGGIYSDANGVYGDNQFRYMLLCLAALEAPLQLSIGGSTYGEDVVFMANDWHASLVPIYLAGKFRPGGVYQQARCILAIHNLRHQGVYPPSSFASLGLPGHWYGALEWQYPPHQRQGSYAEEGRAVNHLKAGITTADRVVTVSPGYSWEIQTPEGGWGMEGLLKSRSYVLNGVLNGIDEVEWNPKTDRLIERNYDKDTYREGKAANKVALQTELGLPVRSEVPLFGFVGRLDYQKGADLVLGAAPWLMGQDVQLVCLGTGDPALENGMRWLESAYPDKARAWVGFNVPISHRITAACDFLLMPSRFEPCGLNQLYAMAYGAVPIAHATGGLRDTVIPFDPWKGTGTGWTFTPCTVDGFIASLRTALETFWHHRDSFHALQERGMERDSSWDKAAQEYEQIFDWAKTGPAVLQTMRPHALWGSRRLTA